VRGEITRITIGFHAPDIENSVPSNHAWFLTSVDIVETTNPEKKYQFICNQWLDPYSQDGLCEVDLYPLQESDIITIFVVEAKALPSKATNGFRSNAYAVVKYGSQSYHTAIVDMTINPVFIGYPARFQKEVEIFNFQVEFWHFEYSTLQSVLIDRMTFHLPPDNSDDEFWINLDPSPTYCSDIGRKRKRSDSWDLGRLFRIESPMKKISQYNSNRSPKKETPEPTGYDAIMKKYRVDFGAPTAHIRIHNGTGFELVDHCAITLSQKVLETFQTGDVIAFSGRTLLACMIKFDTDSPYSHLGVVIRMPDPFTGKEEIFIVESTQNLWNVEDYIEKIPRKGVTLFKLEERIRRIDAFTAWHLPLKIPLNSKEKSDLISLAMKLHEGKIRYDIKQLLEFMAGRECKEDLRELFCSEMVALILRTVGRLPEDSNPSAVTPGDVVHSDCFSTRGPNVKKNLLRFQVEKTQEMTVISFLIMTMTQKCSYLEIQVERASS
jgi:hypothetical protein